jgi:pimeloyl-ACP methyl ester carboxylesterase
VDRDGEKRLGGEKNAGLILNIWKNHAHFFVRRLLAPALLILAAFTPLAAMSGTGTGKIGIVVMHGKGSSPTGIISELVSALDGQGFLVSSLEMPWSKNRQYDSDVAAAEAQVESALRALRAKGATKLFVAGHSQGGLFALHFGNKHVVDGIIAIAPGGNVAAELYKDKLGKYVSSARSMIDAGKGQEKARFADYEGSRGTIPVDTTAAAYFSWFDPAGAMNEPDAIRNMNPAVPVLFIAPSRDYPALYRIKQQMYDLLPKNPRTKLYEPNSSHLEAPTASIKEIVEWTTGFTKTQ